MRIAETFLIDAMGDKAWIAQCDGSRFRGNVYTAEELLEIEAACRNVRRKIQGR